MSSRFVPTRNQQQQYPKQYSHHQQQAPQYYQERREEFPHRGYQQQHQFKIKREAQVHESESLRMAQPQQSTYNHLQIPLPFNFPFLKQPFHHQSHPPASHPPAPLPPQQNPPFPKIYPFNQRDMTQVFNPYHDQQAQVNQLNERYNSSPLQQPVAWREIQGQSRSLSPVNSSSSSYRSSSAEDSDFTQTISEEESEYSLHVDLANRQVNDQIHQQFNQRQERNYSSVRVDCSKQQVSLPVSLPVSLQASLPVSLPASLPVSLPMSLPASLPVPPQQQQQRYLHKDKRVNRFIGVSTQHIPTEQQSEQKHQQIDLQQSAMPQLESQIIESLNIKRRGNFEKSQSVQMINIDNTKAVPGDLPRQAEEAPTTLTMKYIDTAIEGKLEKIKEDLIAMIKELNIRGGAHSNPQQEQQQQQDRQQQLEQQQSNPQKQSPLEYSTDKIIDKDIKIEQLHEDNSQKNSSPHQRRSQPPLEKSVKTSENDYLLRKEHQEKKVLIQKSQQNKKQLQQQQQKLENEQSIEREELPRCQIQLQLVQHSQPHNLSQSDAQFVIRVTESQNSKKEEEELQQLQLKPQKQSEPVSSQPVISVKEENLRRLRDILSSQEINKHKPAEILFCDNNLRP